jgi:hypothetical protein
MDTGNALSSDSERVTLGRKAKNTEVFIAAIVVLALCNWVHLTHFYLTMDGEYQNNILQTILLGRWFDAALKSSILPEPYHWFWSVFVGIVFVAAAAATVVKALELTRGAAILFAIIFASFPQLTYQFEFLNQADTVGIGFFMASCAYYIQKNSKNRVLGSLLSIVLTAFSIGVYQSFIFFNIFLFVADMLRASLTNKLTKSDFLRRAVRPALITLVAFIIASFISTQLRFYFHTPESSYLSNQLEWLRRPLSASFIAVIGSLGRLHLGLYSYGLWVYPLIFVPLAVFLGNRRSKTAADLRVLIFLAYLLVPCSMIILAGGPVPTRTLLLLGLSLGIAAALLSEFLAFGVAMNTLLAGIFMLYGIFFSSELYYSDLLTFRADKLLGTNIATDIKNKFPKLSDKGQLVYFYGGISPDYRWQKYRSEVFRHSFFSWDGGNNSRIVSFMGSSNIASFAGAPWEKLQKSGAMIASMPSWPHPGYIGMDNGILIVKLSDDPGYVGSEFEVRTALPSGIGLKGYLGHFTRTSAWITAY